MYKVQNNMYLLMMNGKQLLLGLIGMHDFTQNTHISHFCKPNLFSAPANMLLQGEAIYHENLHTARTQPSSFFSRYSRYSSSEYSGSSSSNVPSTFTLVEPSLSLSSSRSFFWFGRTFITLAAIRVASANLNIT